MRRLLLLPLILAAAAAAPPPASPGGKALAEMRRRHEGRQAELAKQLEKIQAEMEALEERATARHLELVKKYPDDPGVFPALERLLLDATPHAALALELITRHHLDNSRIGRLGLFLVEADEGLGSKTEALLRGALEKSPHRDVRGQAGLALARLLIGRADSAGKPDARARRQKEAEAVLTEVVAKYASVRLPTTGEDDEDRRIGTLARPMLFELQRLAVGKEVPDLSGPADDGKGMKLSDRRGKVVVLVFWSAASGASAELLPRLKALQERHAGRLEVVGVADEGEGPRPGWRSFRDGPAIAARWNLRSWPALYLIDAKGVIRARWSGPPEAGELEKAAAGLVGE